MDIIAAHQQGLIEQLDAEVDALAGRTSDHAQQAVVLHHLYDHSRGAHQWALCESRRSLLIASAISRLRRRLDRWGWTFREREGAEEALDVLAEALGGQSRARTMAAYRCYRLSATAALRDEAEAGLPPELLAALDQCHLARREGRPLDADSCLALSEASERLAEAATDGGQIDAAWAAIETSDLRRSARRLLGDKALARCEAKGQRKGWERVELALRSDPALPASFRANPAQHFYALQRALTERRRQQWRELCDRESDAVALAA